MDSIDVRAEFGRVVVKLCWPLNVSYVRSRSSQGLKQRAAGQKHLLWNTVCSPLLVWTWLRQWL
jgi:hypothetical protein